MPEQTTIAKMLDSLVKQSLKIVDNSICGKCSCCGECCTNFLPVCQEEVDIIQKYVIENNIIPQKQMLIMQNTLTCPYYDGKKCLIYEVRPLICKEFYCYKKPSAELGKKFQEKKYISVDMWGIAEDIEKQRKKISRNEKEKYHGMSEETGEIIQDRIEYWQNKYYETQKELNNLKEIEQLHQEENGKLRVELEQEKEKNKELEKHQKQYLDGELITAKQGKFFEKMIKENYIRKDKIKAIQGQLCMELGSYVRNETNPEQERIAGGINIINKILEEN